MTMTDVRWYDIHARRRYAVQSGYLTPSWVGDQSGTTGLPPHLINRKNRRRAKNKIARQSRKANRPR